MTNKIGFHLGIGGNARGIMDYVKRLDSQGIPAVIKSADDYGVCFETVEVRKQSGVPHVVIFRLASPRDGWWPDVPAYNLTPRDAAALHWQKTKQYLPPEFDKSVWLEVINEPDKNRSEWLAEFSLHIAGTMLAEGYMPALFGWSGGEPEPANWRGQKMLELLYFVSTSNGRCAISLHEYDFQFSGFANCPHLIGRYRWLFDICDEFDIAHPPVLITELGWTHDRIGDHVISDVAAAQSIYNNPKVLGAGLWYLGGGYGDIAQKLQPYIEPITNYIIDHNGDKPPPPPPPPDPDPPPPTGDGAPREQYARVYWVIHPAVPEEVALAIVQQAYLNGRRTVGSSFDDAGIGALNDKTAVIIGAPDNEHQTLRDWYARWYPGTRVEFESINKV